MARTQWPAWNPNSFARDSRCLMTLMMLRFQTILVFPRISSYRIAPLSLFCRHLHTPFSIIFPSFNSWVEAHMVQKCSEWWVHVARLQHAQRPRSLAIQKGLVILWTVSNLECEMVVSYAHPNTNMYVLYNPTIADIWTTCILYIYIQDLILQTKIKNLRSITCGINKYILEHTI